MSHDYVIWVLGMDIGSNVLPPQHYVLWVFDPIFLPEVVSYFWIGICKNLGIVSTI